MLLTRMSAASLAGDGGFGAYVLKGSALGIMPSRSPASLTRLTQAGRPRTTAELRSALVTLGAAVDEALGRHSGLAAAALSIFHDRKVVSAPRLQAH